MEEYIRLRKSEKIADQFGQFENFFSGTDLKKMREDKLWYLYYKYHNLSLSERTNEIIKV